MWQKSYDAVVWLISRLILGQYITSLALRFHLTPPRLPLCIFWSICFRSDDGITNLLIHHSRKAVGGVHVFTLLVYHMHVVFLQPDQHVLYPYRTVVQRFGHDGHQRFMISFYSKSLTIDIWWKCSHANMLAKAWHTL